MKKGKFRKAVFIVTYKREKETILYLLLKRKLHWVGWEFPKGGIEKSETPLQAVIRELKEETSLCPKKIESYNLKGGYDYSERYPDRKGFTGQSWQLFSAQVQGTKVKLDREEHSVYKWLKFKQALKLLTWQNQKECLRIVNKSLKQ